MAILYVDFEEGNDNYGGTSFDLLASGSDGNISSTTFSSSSANFPNDGTLINQYLSIFNGSAYSVYKITTYISSTSLTISSISGGAGLSDRVDMQYHIGGRWKTLTTGALSNRLIAGDNIRIKASKDQTSLGINGTWTSSSLNKTKTVNSSTNSTPIVVTSNAHGYSNGDTVVITGHTVNTNANGTWEITDVTTNTFTLIDSIGNGVGGQSGSVRLRNNSVVKLASAVTKNIASCGNRGSDPPKTVWTASTNVTTTQNTSLFKEGDCSDSISIGSAFTTGKAAYQAVNLDLSSYQQVSFWIRQTSGTVITDGQMSLRLCSDTNGDNTVHTVEIPSLVSLNNWLPVTVDLGVNLNSSIQSIALYTDQDIGAVVVLLDNIIACKASSSNDSLSLVSLIGKNTGSEPWVSIQSINDTRVFLDGLVSHSPITTTLMGYVGTSETVTTYKREPITVKSTQICNKTAAYANPIVVSGGWNSSDMSTQNAETYLSFIGSINGFSLSTSTSDLRYWNYSKLNIFRSNVAFNFTNYTGVNITDIRDINNNNVAISQYNYGVRPPGPSNVNNIINIMFNSTAINMNSGVANIDVSNIENISSNSSHSIYMRAISIATYGRVIQNITNIVNNGNGIYCEKQAILTIDNITNMKDNNTNFLRLVNCYNCYFSNINMVTSRGDSAYSATDAISISSGLNFIFTNINIDNSTQSAFNFNNSFNVNLKFINVNTSNNVRTIREARFGNVYFMNCNCDESTFMTYNEQTFQFFSTDANAYLQRHNNNSNNHLIYMPGGLISSNTSVRHTDSGISWALSPTNGYRNSLYPIVLSTAKALVFADKLVTVKGFLRRTNTALNLSLKVKGYQIQGVDNDISAPSSGSANTWEEVTMTFTPTETAVIELIAEAYGGSTYTGYVDDITISQEP